MFRVDEGRLIFDTPCVLTPVLVEALDTVAMKNCMSRLDHEQHEYRTTARDGIEEQ